MQLTQGKWAGRFIWAAVVQGLILTIITVLIVEPQSYFNINSYYSPSKVIAGGGGGTWLFTGYILYLTVGVIAVAVTAMFYFYIEGVSSKVYHGLTNYLAWGHYIFMNVGVAGSMLLMILGWLHGRLCRSSGCLGEASVTQICKSTSIISVELSQPNWRPRASGSTRRSSWRSRIHTQKQNEVRPTSFLNSSGL